MYLLEIKGKAEDLSESDGPARRIPEGRRQEDKEGGGCHL